MVIGRAEHAHLDWKARNREKDTGDGRSHTRSHWEWLASHQVKLGDFYVVSNLLLILAVVVTLQIPLLVCARSSVAQFPRKTG